MARELPIFPALFALFTAVSVFLLLLGLGPPLGQLLPELRESFEAWGRGDGPFSALWRGMAEAGHFSAGSGRMAFDYALSVLNVALGVFLVWQRPRDKTARLLGLALVGTGVVFNIASHSFLVTTWFFLNGVHVAVHAVAASAYSHALLVFPNGKLSPRWTVWLLVLGYSAASAIVMAYIAVTFFGGTFEDLGYDGETPSAIYAQIRSATRYCRWSSSAC